MDQARRTNWLLLMVGLAASVSVSPAFGQWAPPSWRAQRLGFVDPIHTRSDGQQQSLVMGDQLLRDGLTVGISERYLGDAYVGASAWASTRTFPLRRIGFFDGAHTSSSGAQESSVGQSIALANGRRSAINALGQTLGTSTRYTGDAATGKSAWIWDPTLGTVRVGPVGGVFVGPDGQQSAEPRAFDDSGRVVGSATRYDTPASLDGVSIPAASAFVTTTTGPAQLIGLIDSVHTRESDGYQRHEARGMNNAGLVVGISYRFDVQGVGDPGQSAWTWSAAAGTRRIGPVGSRYVDLRNTQYAYVLPPTANGDVAGASWTFDSDWVDVGRDAWVIPAGQSVPTLLGFTDAIHTGFAGIQRSEPTSFSFTGPLRIFGYSTRYNPELFFFPEGRTAWSWTPTEGLLDIGLRDAEHIRPDGMRDSVPILSTPSGIVAGFATRYSGTTQRTGQSIWTWTPPSPSLPQGQTRRLGLFDALHTSAEGFQRSEIYGINSAGLMVGVSYRYNGRSDSDNTSGRTAWVYDSTTQQQTSLVFSTSSTGDAVALPLSVSEDGVVGGYYLEYQGTAIVAQRAFVSSAARGASTVNAILEGGPLANAMENAFYTNSLDLGASSGIIYAMPPGVIWTPAGVGSWATAYRIDQLAGCDSIDFNRDTLFPDSGDLDDFIAVLAGGPSACSTFPTPGCSDIDFNNDGLFPDSGDLDAFLSRLAGGACL
jgi:hypothetical protein